MAEVQEELTEERQPIDAINFSLLCFLSADDNNGKGLRDLLEQYTRVELTKTPFFRRMRGLIEQGFVAEEKVDAYGTILYSLTEAGKKHTIEWAHSMQTMAAMALYCLEYTQTEEYENESK